MLNGSFGNLLSVKREPLFSILAYSLATQIQKNREAHQKSPTAKDSKKKMAKEICEDPQTWLSLSLL
jgi:hypothetical protein